MHNERASLAARLAVLIDGDNNSVPAPGSSIRAPAITTTPSALTPMAQVNQQIAPGLSNMPAAAHAAGWTLPVLEQFAQQALSDPSVAAAQHPGVTRARVRALLPEHLKAQDAHMLHWLHAARVLVPPVSATDPFRHPRPLQCAGVQQLVDCLLKIPYPYELL